MAVRKLNVKGQLPNSATALLTAGAKESIVLNGGAIMNASGSDVSGIKFYIYPSGGSASDSTQVRHIDTILDDEDLLLDLRHQLYDGDVLAALAGTNNAVNYVIDYTLTTNV